MTSLSSSTSSTLERHALAVASPTRLMAKSLFTVCVETFGNLHLVSLFLEWNVWAGEKGKLKNRKNWCQIPNPFSSFVRVSRLDLEVDFLGSIFGRVILYCIIEAGVPASLSLYCSSQLACLLASFCSVRAEAHDLSNRRCITGTHRTHTHAQRGKALLQVSLAPVRFAHTGGLLLLFFPSLVLILIRILGETCHRLHRWLVSLASCVRPALRPTLFSLFCDSAGDASDDTASFCLPSPLASRLGLGKISRPFFPLWFPRGHWPVSLHFDFGEEGCPSVLCSVRRFRRLVHGPG